METKQNPFSLYDFLGYFTPGALFIYAVMAIYAHVHLEVQAVTFIAEKLSFEKTEIYIPFVLGAYTLGHLLSYCSSLFIEKYSVWTTGYPSRYLLNLEVRPYFFGNKIVRSLVAIFLLPISLPDYLLNKLIGFRKTYANSMDSLLANIVDVKVMTFFIENSGLKGVPDKKEGELYRDFFRFIYHYAVENAKNHYPKMQNYVAIYGFLRTITFIHVLLFWTLIISHLSNFRDQFFFYLVPLSIAITFIYYLAFVKFYRRFSLEVFMALAAIYEVKKPREIKNKSTQ